MSKIGWDRQLEMGLPDSRLTVKRERTTVVRPTMLGRMVMERVFCANCGDDGGLVTAEWSPHVFYLCEECAQKHGRLNLPEIPEATVRGM